MAASLNAWRARATRLEHKTLGRYRILGELGRGAMGAVYRAVDPLIEREVAIKTLLPNLPAEVMDEVRERFIREARSAGRLNHPNIVTIFDVGEHDGVAYIAMELLEGKSLQQILKDGKPLPCEITADIVSQVADALDSAQQFKIVHRDVKPANVMVSPSGRVKLADFGVARLDTSSMTQTGAALGSPKYMSPEQVLGQAVDARSDIFSLGVVLYEMLVRRTPFERPTDTTVFSLMNRIAGEPHTPVRKIDPQIPEGFDQILQRALAKKPDQRYARAADMAADLRAVRGGRPGEYEKTVVLGKPPPAKDGRFSSQAGSELITDLEKFAKDFEHEEQARLRAEEEERLRKEAEVQRWLEEQARGRDEFERTRLGGATLGTPSVSQPAAADQTMSGIRRAGALDFLKQKAATQPAKENPAVARARAIAALDQALRAAFQYLAEVVKEMNSITPTAALPYEFLYLGKLPLVSLSEGFVDSRPVHIPGKDVMAHIMMRYRITPSQPARFSLMGEDIVRCIQFLKSNRVEYKAQAEARNDFGKVTKALFAVTGSLPCELVIRGDYDHPAVVVELLNVRRGGRQTCRLSSEELDELTDDLARYVLGVDDDFEKALRRR
jgi:hypothetical protein